MRVFRERLSVYVCTSSPFGFDGGMWDLIVLVPNHCLSFLLLRSTQNESFCRCGQGEGSDAWTTMDPSPYEYR